MKKELTVSTSVNEKGKVIVSSELSGNAFQNILKSFPEEPSELEKYNLTVHLLLERFCQRINSLTPEQVDATMQYIKDPDINFLGSGYLPIEGADEDTSLLSVTVKDTGKEELDLSVVLECSPFPMSLRTKDAKAKAAVSVLLKKCSDILLHPNTDWEKLFKDAVEYLSEN